MDGFSEYKASVALMRQACGKKSLNDELKILQEAIKRATAEGKDHFYLPVGSLSDFTLAKVINDFSLSYGSRFECEGRVVESSNDNASLICFKLNDQSNATNEHVGTATAEKWMQLKKLKELKKGSKEEGRGVSDTANCTAPGSFFFITSIK